MAFLTPTCPLCSAEPTLTLDAMAFCPDILCLVTCWNMSEPADEFVLQKPLVGPPIGRSALSPHRWADRRPDTP